MSGRSSPRVIDERGDVVRHQTDVDRSIDVGGPTMPLEVHSDDLVALGQQR